MARRAARISLALAMAGAWLGLAISSSGIAAQQQPGGVAAAADIRDASGRTLATAELREDQGKVQVALMLPNPSTLTGKHALHVMSIGRCDPPEFTSAAASSTHSGRSTAYSPRAARWWATCPI
jgi:Cu/Zn superoxide dismutase